MLEPYDYDSYSNNLVLENGSSDIGETDIMTEIDEVDDFLRVSDSENESADFTDVVGKWTAYRKSTLYVLRW